MAEADTVPDGIDGTPSLSVRVQDGNCAPLTTSGTAQIGFDRMFDPFGTRRAARLLALFNAATAYATLRYRERLLDLRTREV